MTTLRGRPKLTAEEKIKRGTFRPSRENEKVVDLPVVAKARPPEEEGKPIEPPKWLKGRSRRAKYRELAAQLTSFGIFDELDADTLASYCDGQVWFEEQRQAGIMPKAMYQNQLERMRHKLGLDPDSRMQKLIALEKKSGPKKKEAPTNNSGFGRFRHKPKN